MKPAVWIVFCAALMPVVAPAAEDGSKAAIERDSRDWPVIISTLKESLWRSPNDGSVKTQLSIAHNNYGVKLGDQGKWQLAIDELEEAVKLDPQTTDFRKNLSRMYLQQAASLRTEAANRSTSRQQDVKVAGLVRKALTYDPTAAEAYAMLGEIEYENQRLKEAKQAWEKASKLNPNLPGLREAMQKLSEELPVEGDFDRLTHLYFDIRYEESQVNRSVGFDVQETLLQARRDVGNAFRYWPSNKMIVLVYSAQTFHAMRQNTPEWVGGQYDGKIRLPLPGGELDASVVRQILYHEYTHALVRDLAAGKCPVWLNEGLAEYQGARAGRRYTELLAEALKKNQLFPWKELDAHFSPSLSAAEVGLAYQEAHSIVAYLSDRYGFWRLRKVLANVGGGMPVDQALSKEFHTPLERLERNWRDWLPGFAR